MNFQTTTMTNFSAPDSRIPSRRRKPKGRVCKSENCESILSMYNPDKICAQCFEKTPLVGRATNTGKYL